MTEKKFFTLAEAAERYGIPYYILLDEVKAKQLKAFLPTGRTRGYMTSDEWVSEYVESHATSN